MIYALNRENMISKIYNGNATLANLPIHSRSYLYSSEWYTEFNVDKAKQILNNADFVNDGKKWTKNNTRLQFTLLVNEENEELLKVAEIIKDNLAEILIPITIKKMKMDAMQKAIEKGDFELALVSIDIKNNELNTYKMELDKLRNTNQELYGSIQKCPKIFRKLFTKYSW